MTELVVAALRVGFLAILWLFILFVANIIRTDLIGQTVPADEVGLGRKARREHRRAARAHRGAGGPQPAVEVGPTRATVIAGRSVGEQAALEGVLTIGRSSGQALTIDDDYASTRHAIVRQDGVGNWVVEDLNSTNGTYVNGTMITRPTVIGAGDLIRIGRTQIQLEQ